MKIYVGIPFYGGACAEFVSSLLKTHVALHLAGFEVEVDMHTNCSVLPKARNEIVARFLASGFDKLLFLDTDLKFSLVDIFKLINSEHDVCAIDYRKKSEEVAYTGILTGREKEGWLEAFSVGAGLLCINRTVIEQMTQKFPELRYVSDDGAVVFALFDFILEAGRYKGEDVTFCHRWRDCGGSISVLKDAETSHIGPHKFTGNLQEEL